MKQRLPDSRVLIRNLVKFVSMPWVKFLGVFVMSFLVLHQSYAQKRMSSYDVSFLYDEEHEFLVNYKVASSGTQFKVYLQFMLNSGNVKITDYDISYDLRNNYIDEQQSANKIALDSSALMATGFRQFIYEISFNKPSNQKIMVVDVFNRMKDSHYVFDIPLSFGDFEPAPYLLFEPKKDIPYFPKFLTVKKDFRIKNVFGASGNYELSGIVNNKKMAPPPFDLNEYNVPTEVKIDTLFGTNENEPMSLYNPGYYRISSPNFEGTERHILVHDEYYPYFGKYEDLIKPLILITTNNEYNSLRNSEDVRDVFEAFVQDAISSNPESAKNFIKYYYRRIRTSARLFTENKAGWKTDRGIIYQIFGKPNQVFRNELTEVWTYANLPNKENRFVFDIFRKGENTKYVLKRNKRFEENWMAAVEQWRKARIID